MNKLHKIKFNHNSTTVSTTFEGEQVVVYHSKFNTMVAIANHDGIFTLESFNRKPLHYINNCLSFLDIELIISDVEIQPLKVDVIETGKIVNYKFSINGNAVNFYIDGFLVDTMTDLGIIKNENELKNKVSYLLSKWGKKYYIHS